MHSGNKCGETNFSSWGHQIKKKNSDLKHFSQIP